MHLLLNLMYLILYGGQQKSPGHDKKKFHGRVECLASRYGSEWYGIDLENPIPPLLHSRTIILPRRSVGYSNTTEFAFANGKLTPVAPFSQGKLSLARLDQFFHWSRVMIVHILDPHVISYLFMPGETVDLFLRMPDLNIVL